MWVLKNRHTERSSPYLTWPLLLCTLTNACAHPYTAFKWALIQYALHTGTWACSLNGIYGNSFAICLLVLGRLSGNTEDTCNACSALLLMCWQVGLIVWINTWMKTTNPVLCSSFKCKLETSKGMSLSVLADIFLSRRCRALTLRAVCGETL